MLAAKGRLWEGPFGMKPEADLAILQWIGGPREGWEDGQKGFPPRVMLRARKPSIQ